jgi:hypothetical protein
MVGIPRGDFPGPTEGRAAMTNTQRLEQGIEPIDATAELAGFFAAVVQHAGRTAAELWNEFRQWG